MEELDLALAAQHKDYWGGYLVVVTGRDCVGDMGASVNVRLSVKACYSMEDDSGDGRSEDEDVMLTR